MPAMNELKDYILNIDPDHVATDAEAIALDDDISLDFDAYKAFMAARMSILNIDLEQDPYRDVASAEELYDRMERDLNDLDGDGVDDTEEHGVAIDIQKDLEKERLYQEYLDRNKHDGGNLLSEEEFYGMLDAEASMQEIDSLDDVELGDLDGLEGELEDGLESGPEDGLENDDYDEYGDEFGDKLEDMPLDDAIEVPDEEIIPPDELEDGYIGVENEGDDFKALGDGPNLNDSIVNYDSATDAPDQNQQQLVPQAPETQVISHEDFKVHDGLDALADGTGLKSGVIEYEVKEVVPETPQQSVMPAEPVQPTVQQVQLEDSTEDDPSYPGA